MIIDESELEGGQAASELLYFPIKSMSAEEIILELRKLDRRDLEMIEAKLHELLRSQTSASEATFWGESLLELAGTAEGLPVDYAHNHDRYLHGAGGA